MSILGVLELNLVFAVAGLGVTWGLRGWETWRDLTTHLGISYILGLSAVGVGATLALVAGLGLSYGTVLGLAGGVTVAGALAGRLLGHPLPRANGLSLAMPRTVGEALEWLAAGLTLAVALALFGAFRHQPLVAYDAWNFWVPKARAIYFFGGLDEHLFRTLPAPSYPLFVPALDAMTFRFVHSTDATALAVQYWFLFVGFVAAAAALLARIARRSLVWLFLLAISVLPEIEHYWFQLLGDWPLDAFFALSALLLVRWHLTREAWLLAALPLPLAAMLATKREGQLLALCLLLGTLAATVRGRRRWWPRLVALTAGAYALQIPWRLWWSSRHLSPDSPEGGVTHLGHWDRVLPSLHIVLEIVFSYQMWLLAVPLALAAAVALTTHAQLRPIAASYLVTAATAFGGFTWIMVSYVEIPFTTRGALNPVPREAGSLALLSLALMPVLVTGLVAEHPFRVFDLGPREALGRLPLLRARIESLRPGHVLGVVIVAEWLVVAGVGATVKHDGWLWYQGGDQLWHYTTSWLLAHGHVPFTAVGYGWSILLLPFAALGGPNLMQPLPLIVLLNVLVLMPIGILATYGIGERIGGRLFGYWVALLWIVIPLAGIRYTNAGYHQRYTELLLPQAFGLTAMSDFPSMVALAVSAYFCLRAAQDHLRGDAALAGLFAGVGIGIKPSSSLYLLGAALALVFSRRWRTVAWFAVALAPTLVTLAMWKYRGVGNLPLFAESATVRLAAAAGMHGGPLLGGLGLQRYFHPNWQHFTEQLDLLREYFWSGRLIEWFTIAGLIGLARKSRPGALLIGGWVFAFVADKWTYPLATIADSNLLRMMIPTIPAFLLLAASVPLILPGLPRRLPVTPIAPWATHRIRVGLGAGAVLVFCAVPLALAGIGTPLRATETVSYELRLAPGALSAPFTVDRSLKLTATRAGGTVSLAWRPAHATGSSVMYRILRAPANASVDCGSGPGAAQCVLEGVVLATTVSDIGWTDRPRRGRWVYRLGLVANWERNPAGGDIYAVGPPLAVTVP